ncbi:MAG: tetratricopeptide repeat protein [Anaerolineae bacterium]
MSETRTETEPGTKYVLQEPVRLSQSMLWQLQRRFFERRGHAAWGSHIVPSYITTNPFIAAAYARVIFGFIRDCARAGAPLGPLDPAQPLYILELGAGAGRLAFNLLQSLTASLAHSCLRNIQIRYILTDLVAKNLDFVSTHPALQAWIQAGLVDFALFDAEHPAPLVLRHSGQVLAPGAVSNPLVLVANYFFDSIPQDAFYVENGQLNESLLKLTYPQPEPDLDDLDLFRQLTLVYQRQPAAPDYYADPELNRLLEMYRRQVDQGAVDFPNVALDALRFFRELARDRLLLITGDKGYDRPENLEGRQEPGYAVHGSFSMMVNYHALGQYFANGGGQVLRTSYRYTGLNILAMLLGAPPDGYAETHQAFFEVIDRQGPDDFFSLAQGIEPYLGGLSLDQFLSYLRLSGWDSHIFIKCFPTLLDQVGSATERQQDEVRRAVGQLWNHYYYIGDESDVPFDLGMLLFKIGDHAEALDFFDISLKLFGPAASTYYNQAVCLYRFDRNQEALDAVNRALEINAEMEQAYRLRAGIRKALGAMNQ